MLMSVVQIHLSPPPYKPYRHWPRSYLIGSAGLFYLGCFWYLQTIYRLQFFVLYSVAKQNKAVALTE